ncbi:MAG: polysulfide reductase NrfD [Coriobacteriia bacterium]|nr:polysulfide reductase NrfD [Coriobacteriia bacterium]
MDKTLKNPLTIALAVVAAIGVGVWIYQLANGLGITGMDNMTSWGLYLACFMFFGGVASGALAIAASIEVFNLDAWKPIQIPAAVCAIVCICCAGICVLLDIGGIQRVWRMIVGLNIESPLAWDMLVITASIVVDALFLHALCFKKDDAHRAGIIARIALPLAVLCVAVEAWVFGMQVAKEAWGAMLAPVFVASALDSGLALVILACLALKVKGLEAGQDLLGKLARLLSVFVAVDFFLIFCEIATAAYTGESLAGLVLTGSLAPLFWVEVICGLVLPFCMLAAAGNGKNPVMVAAASALVLVGVLCKRCWVLLSGFAFANVSGGSGVTLGTVAAQTGGVAQVWTQTGSYLPTIPEAVIAVAVFALAALGFIVVYRLLAQKAS